jgi:hypothetical protein
MPVISVDIAHHAPALRKAISALKAALVVSAAAVLSQVQGDLEANTKAALGHLDDFGTALHAVRDDILQQATTALRPAGDQQTELDTNLLTLLVNVVENRSATFRQALYDIVGSPERDGLDDFVAAIGELGTATHDVIAALTGPPPQDNPPFRYDQFFLESMQDLSQRDWSAN